MTLDNNTTYTTYVCREIGRSEKQNSIVMCVIEFTNNIYYSCNDHEVGICMNIHAWLNGKNLILALSIKCLETCKHII